MKHGSPRGILNGGLAEISDGFSKKKNLGEISEGTSGGILPSYKSAYFSTHANQRFKINHPTYGKPVKFRSRRSSVWDSSRIVPGVSFGISQEILSRILSRVASGFPAIFSTVMPSEIPQRMASAISPTV